MEDKEIIEKVRGCIKLLHEDFRKSDYYVYEIEMHFGFYHILCSNIPYLFQNDELLDCYKNKKDLMKKAKRIWIETKTENKYPNKKRGKKESGRFDIAIYGKSREQSTPLIAIELKLFWKAKKELFLRDFKKLDDPVNGVKYPIFIYLEHLKYDSEYEKLFKNLKSKYPKVNVFYLADNKYKEINN